MARGEMSSGLLESYIAKEFEMSLPGFSAEMTIYKTSRCYRVSSVVGVDTSGRISAAVLKGTFCTVRDPNCASGFSSIRCIGSDPESCTETGICCTPPKTGGGGGGLVNCGTHSCNPGSSCCGPACCARGTHCCANKGCCPNGYTCRSIFGHHFCSPV